MISVLPFASFSIWTPLTPDAVEARLAGQVRPPSWFSVWQPGPPYEGRVAGQAFRISRVIHYRNSFLPVLVGRLQAEAGGTRVAVLMRPPLPTLAFMVIWFGGLLLIGGGIATVDLTALPFVMGMALFGYALVWGGFWWEARSAPDSLRAIVQPNGPEAATRRLGFGAPPPDQPTTSLPDEPEDAPAPNYGGWAGGTPESKRYGRPPQR